MEINKKIIRTLKANGVGVLPTDTLYGLVCSALSKKAVDRVYRLKKRNKKKPCIVLINCLRDLNFLGISLDEQTKDITKKFWPGQVSIVLPCPNKALLYLHKGTKTLAVRMPKTRWLRDLIRQTGPLIAPSANIEKSKPSQTIEQAKGYFKNRVDFYAHNGELKGAPSTLIKIIGRKIKVLRQGAIKI